MAVLTATDWTMAVVPTAAMPSMGPDPRSMGVIKGKDRMTRVRMTLATTVAGVYPSSGGVPLPSWSASAHAHWGMSSYLTHVIMYGDAGTATGTATGAPVWKYSPTDHSMKGYALGVTTAVANKMLHELPTTWTPTMAAGSVVLYFEAHGW